MVPVVTDATYLTNGRSEMSNKGANGPKSAETKGHVPNSGSVSSSDAASQSVNPSTNVTILRSVQPIARDARIENDTTLDFADFIRSTGPEHDPHMTPRMSPRSIATSGLNTAASSSPRSTPASQPASPRRVPRKLSKSAPGLGSTATTKKLEPAPPARPALKPRDAVVPFGDQSSDLIDFIRQGPPLDGAHRIPRAVAPFRTTMDSDEIRELGHGRAKDAATPISFASTHDGSTQSKSVHSSLNSRTGLLEASNRSGSRSYASSATVRAPPRSDEPPHPVRKQRRVRDPYAIESESDEDDGSRTSRQEEESLVDFLRNVPPPVNEGLFQGQAAMPSTPPNGFAESIPITSGIRIVPQSTSKSGKGGNEPRKPPIQLRVNTSSPLNQNPNITDVRSFSQPNHATQVGRERNDLGRSYVKTTRGLLARSESSSADGSQDLAEFLRSSEPPMMRNAYSPSVTKEETGFAKMFSRRKKSTGVA